MNKYRLVFSKTGRAVYTSHLDVMRALRRAFRRAGVNLKHSAGFNPHPLMSIALPLSVGQESLCEILDFETESPCDNSSLSNRLNAVLPEGIRAVKSYIPVQKIASIKWISIEGQLRYDNNLPDITQLSQIFQCDSLILTKKTKRGETDIDIKTTVQNVKFSTDGVFITLKALVSAREPVVNPSMLVELLEPLPDFTLFRRVELLNDKFEVFR